MSTFYDFGQRVHLRRDPSQWGYIGTSPTGALYDLETRSQDVFWEHAGADIVSGVRVDDLMSEEEYTSTQTMERLYDGVQALLDEREGQG
jgi:hypothetical protein